eukprot:TRINITY_DN3700_c0_g1_i1.p1 TRINITY_DN3700_c0_g1~~TRINITY_DN3700_c0_g1_i1.p1  ORF type:complete len:301 (+),score=40.31 TRINITY_DN3700_c0_g1_i1:71-973(+)
MESTKRKALLIGINYNGEKFALRGCHNDVRNIFDFITKHLSYPIGNIKILLDEKKETSVFSDVKGIIPIASPTKKNILDSMKWLVQDGNAGDHLFFHYSGHGSQVKDRDGDELDGFDETILPVDYRTFGEIVDDQIHKNLILPLGEGVVLTAIMDCCHSGTGFDLPFVFKAKGPLPNEKMKSLIKLKSKGGEEKEKASLGDDDTEGISTVSSKHSKGTVILFSGCQDESTSTDVLISGKATGAVSYAFTQIMAEHKLQITFTDLLYKMRDSIQTVQSKTIQIPQISTNNSTLNLNSFITF